MPDRLATIIDAIRSECSCSESARRIDGIPASGVMSHTCLTPAMWLVSIWHSLIRRKRAWPGLARISQGAIRSTAANNVPNLELRLAVGERRYGRADDEAVLGVTVVERVEHGVPDALCCRLLVVGVGRRHGRKRHVFERLERVLVDRDVRI